MDALQTHAHSYNTFVQFTIFSPVRFPCKVYSKASTAVLSFLIAALPASTGM